MSAEIKDFAVDPGESISLAIGFFLGGLRAEAEIGMSPRQGGWT